jgi:hypothetical protein
MVQMAQEILAAMVVSAVVVAVVLLVQEQIVAAAAMEYFTFSTRIMIQWRYYERINL